MSTSFSIALIMYVVFPKTSHKPDRKPYTSPDDPRYLMLCYVNFGVDEGN